MIDKFGCYPYRSENVNFANSKQTSMAVFAAVFCFTKDIAISLVLQMPNIIWLKFNYILFDQRKQLTVSWTLLSEIQRNQSYSLTFKN